MFTCKSPIFIMQLLCSDVRVKIVTLTFSKWQINYDPNITQAMVYMYGIKMKKYQHIPLKLNAFAHFFSIKKYLCHDRHLHTLTHCFWRLSEEWSIFVWSAAFKLAKWRPCLIGWTFSLLSSQLLVSWSIFNHSKFSAAHAHYKMMYVCRTRCKISLSFATFSVHSLA